jgi:hypothetical protein
MNTDLATLRLIDDHAAFVRLPAAAQADILVMLGWVERIDAAVHRRKGSIVQAAAAALGVSPGAVHRYLRWYRQEGWRGLIDKRLRGTGAKGLPEPFKAWIRQLHLQHQRATTGREVQRAALERLSRWRRTGDPDLAIPGYASPPANGPKGHPPGWSEDTILRLRPEAYALATARQGAKVASNFLPSILKTRCGTQFGQVVFFDDQDYDIKVVAPGLSRKSLRPQGFNCLDYLSGCFMQHHIRLRWWDLAAEQYRTLTQQEFTWFVVSYLQRHGYRALEGTTLVFEHGTATGYNNRELSTTQGHHSFDAALAAVSGDKISVHRSGLFNQPAFAGMLFRPQSSGNPNFKAPLESMFNLVRNRMAALPGATGLDRDHKPAEQYGQDRYISQLVKVWERLDERHRDLMSFPLMTPQQFGTAAGAVYDAINSREDHDLEGWERCGFVAPQIRFTPDDRSPWLSQADLARLPDAAQAAAMALAELPGHVRPMKLSPAAVARHHAGELTRLPDHAIPLLIPVQWARPATVKSDRTIALHDQMLGSDPLQYLARFETRDGFHTLHAGTQVLAYLNPFDPERLAICREDGSYIGTLTRMTRATWHDHEAIVDQLKERAALKADLDTAVRPHLSSLIEQRGEMKRVNDRLAAGKPVHPDDVREARRQAGFKGLETAAKNRLDRETDAIDWDNYQPELCDAPADLYAGLADETPLDPSL